ncbi:MAG: hypothetical protein GF320_19100, partial [Armatimonadia bacterium]|nr:hypothetical protein [Armatimonadia bacterium]
MLRFVLAALLLCAPALADLHDDLLETGRDMRGLDLDDDGAPELRAVIPVDGTARETEDAPLALVLIEARLLESPGGMTDLRPHLDTYLDDLADEGWSTAAVSCDLYGGDRHQDGPTLLALREYLRAVHSARPELRAALLIGAFPDAHLVRQVNWWKHGPITLNAETASERIYDDEEGIDYLRSYPESVCFRTDLVLGDLDGHWEDLYHLERTAVPYVIAAFPEGRAAAGFGPDAMEEGTVEFEDFFFVNDGEYRIHTGPDGRILVSPLPSSHAECAPDDLLQPNPMARPEVLIGRLDARHASVIPDPDLTDAHGRTLLADDGTPQVLEFDSEDDAPAPRSYY